MPAQIATNFNQNISMKKTIMFTIVRLHSGWSVKTATINQWKQPEPLTSSEQQMIVDVIQRAEQMEKAEKTRLK